MTPSRSTAGPAADLAAGPADLAAAPATVPALVARQAAERPEALAVTDGTTALTYRELVDNARRLAAELTACGVAPGSAVGVLCARGSRIAVAHLAVWWAGGHVLPLDPAYPAARLTAMLDDAAVRLTLGDKALLAELDLTEDRSLVLTETGPTGTGDDEHGPAPVDPDPAAAAIVYFTSGSTGRPKGVLVPHHAVAELVTAADGVVLRPGDRMLVRTSAGFDLSTLELWGPLANGAALAVPTAERPSAEELARDVERFGVTHAVLATALFHQLAARGSRIFGVLRHVVVGGEALAAEHAGAVLRSYPWLELVNGYGPTEATTFATLHRVRPADCAGPVPIGRPFGGTGAAVLDQDRRPVPDGTRGELWLTGRLALGYLGRPDLTVERFVELPGVGRAYGTGDLVSRRPDGTLDFHGRLDDQVKVRGYRIEPGEVEHALCGLAEVAEAAVVVRRAGREDAALTAFVVAAEGVRPAAESLRRQLAERLPAHLVPTAWTVLDTLPLTGSGKVDRRALAAEEEPVQDAAPVAGPVGPVAEPAALGPIEQAVAAAWSRALETEVTTPDAEFFALGGHSLLAMWVVDDLREDLGVELPLGDFLSRPTVAGQAALIERALLAADSSDATVVGPDLVTAGAHSQEPTR
ncbi:non-ribosomal peptide synthetase [Kitasatospora purpeofusca]|uniref:non-ribosomal peptide synthetase n=1 Tax=Kitasatospora purpeofusca TaxID=67352 RepID=UPI00225BFFCA|nr:non-ribosomal peptide synthetase [Kitasatospora purpeofusca]MCX4689453.1 non-ribosomal peptide synthetase [Kitasatospora purpeofusca]